MRDCAERSDGSIHDISSGLAAVAALHTNRSAIAAFAGPLDGKWRNFFGLSPANLLRPPLTQSQLSILKTDVYVSIHGMRAPTGKSRTTPFLNLLSGRRGEAAVAVLNAVWVDLDTYKVGITDSDALAELRSLRNQGRLPPWSLQIHSGRGVWLVWMLRSDDDATSPPAATELNKDECRRINAALADQLQELGADRNSADLARVVRVPHTLNAKAVAEGRDAVVRWEFASPLPRYTVRELATCLLHKSHAAHRHGFAQQRSAWVDRRTFCTKRAPRGRAFDASTAQIAVHRRWSLPLLDMLALAFYRNGYKRGHRHYALFWIAHLLTLALPSEPMKLAEIHRICRELNAEFPAPLPESSVRRQVIRGTSWKPSNYVSHGDLARRFGVTEEEGSLLRRLKTSPLPRRERRRAALQECRQNWNDAKGCAPTLEELARELGLAGHAVSPATLSRDLRALGCTCTDAPSRSDPAQRTKSSAKNETAMQRRQPYRSKREAPR